MKSAVRPARFQYFLYDNVERRFVRIHDGFLCGRTDGDLKFSSEDAISRKQCRFHIDANDVYVEDLGATNKTKVNTVPLASGKRRRIQLNDVIEFGRHRRFILTNQNKFAPSNIEDVKSKTSFKALLNGDGSMTSQISRLITNQTRLLLDKRTYRKLRVREFTRLRGWDASTSIVLLSLLVLWGGATWFLADRGAFSPGLAHSSWALSSKLLVALLPCTALITLWHYLAIRMRYESVVKRLAFVPVWVFAALASVPLIEAGTSVVSDATENLVELHCVRSFTADSCRPWASAEALGFRRLSREKQETILIRLRRH